MVIDISAKGTSAFEEGPRSKVEFTSQIAFTLSQSLMMRQPPYPEDGFPCWHCPLDSI